MNVKWELDEAGNHLEQIIDTAETIGPQAILKNGVETAVVLSVRDYRRLKMRGQSQTEFLRDSTLAGTDLDIRRDRSPGRN